MNIHSRLGVVFKHPTTATLMHIHLKYTIRLDAIRFEDKIDEMIVRKNERVIYFQKIN
jgi:hypothetical protein